MELVLKKHQIQGKDTFPVDSEIEAALHEKVLAHSEEGFWRTYDRFAMRENLGITSEYIEFINH